jgi:ribonuclease HI
MKKVVLYTDGGARGNPGPAGAGAVIAEENGTVIKEVSEFLGKQTNNFAEYQAVILGLKKLKQLFGSAVWHMDIEVRLDSELIVRQVSDQRAHAFSTVHSGTQYARKRFSARDISAYSAGEKQRSGSACKRSNGPSLTRLGKGVYREEDSRIQCRRGRP